MSPGPWSVASRGYLDLVGIHSLKSVVAPKSTLNLKTLTVVTTLSHGVCTYMSMVSPLKEDAAHSSNLVSNRHSLLHSFSWPALSLLSAVHRLLERIDH